MLLLDDDDVLPDVPDEAETLLAAQLGTDRVKGIDDTLRNYVQDRWMKVARIVADSVRTGGFSLTDGNVVRLHVRRLISRGSTCEAGWRATLPPRLPR